jgi:hypothetical protein
MLSVKSNKSLASRTSILGKKKLDCKSTDGTRSTVSASVSHVSKVSLPEVPGSPSSASQSSKLTLGSTWKPQLLEVLSSMSNVSNPSTVTMPFMGSTNVVVATDASAISAQSPSLQAALIHPPSMAPSLQSKPTSVTGSILSARAYSIKTSKTTKTAKTSKTNKTTATHVTHCSTGASVQSNQTGVHSWTHSQIVP